MLKVKWTIQQMPNKEPTNHSQPSISGLLFVPEPPSVSQLVTLQKWIQMHLIDIFLQLMNLQTIHYQKVVNKLNGLIVRKFLIQNNCHWQSFLFGKTWKTSSCWVMAQQWKELLWEFLESIPVVALYPAIAITFKI